MSLLDYYSLFLKEMWKQVTALYSVADPDFELRWGPDFGLLALPTFLPSIISSFFTQNNGGSLWAPPLDPPLVLACIKLKHAAVCVKPVVKKYFFHEGLKFVIGESLLFRLISNQRIDQHFVNKLLNLFLQLVCGCFFFFFFFFSVEWRVVTIHRNKLKENKPALARCLAF